MNNNSRDLYIHDSHWLLVFKRQLSSNNCCCFFNNFMYNHILFQIWHVRHQCLYIYIMRILQTMHLLYKRIDIFMVNKCSSHCIPMIIFCLRALIFVISRHMRIVQAYIISTIGRKYRTYITRIYIITLNMLPWNSWRRFNC